jgi:hypothetical protein
MKTLPPLFRVAPLALLAFVAACNKSDTAATTNAADSAEANTAAAAPVELPPPLLASRTFRCKDNSVVYIDFYGGEKTADLRAQKDGPVTKLTAEESGKPLTGGGYTVSGTGTEVTMTQPGKPSQSCKA